MGLHVFVPQHHVIQKTFLLRVFTFSDDTMMKSSCALLAYPLKNLYR